MIHTTKMFKTDELKKLIEDALYEQYAYADYNFDMTMEYAPTIIEAESEET